MASPERIRTFSAFYEYYQQEHKEPGTRLLHFVGTGTFITVACTAMLKRAPGLLPLGVVAGYGCAWLGHFLVERNRPATFRYPLWSLLADFKMFFRILTGQESLVGPAKPKPA